MADKTTTAAHGTAPSTATAGSATVGQIILAWDDTNDTARTISLVEKAWRGVLDYYADKA